MRTALRWLAAAALPGVKTQTRATLDRLIKLIESDAQRRAEG